MNGHGGIAKNRIERQPDRISLRFSDQDIGQQQAGFAQAVLEVVNRHDPGFFAASMEMRASRNGRYISLTCTVRATSREQLDALYQDLCDHPSIVMVL